MKLEHNIISTMSQTLLFENLKKSVEFYLLVLVSSCFLYNVSLLNQPDPPYVHQFADFSELSSSVIDCSQKNTFDAHPRCPIANESVLQPYNIIDYSNNNELRYAHIQPGGHFKPDGCSARQRIAIVVPYRDRAEQLEKFTLYMHQVLPNQQIDYTVYVIEQADSKLFNRAKLFNAGVAEILKLRPDICCFIFHDVDLLPTNQRNLYMCSYRPRHLSSSVNTLRYNLLYPQLFGGVIAVTRDQFESIGGFSNRFYGWGGEDDDIFQRFHIAGYGIDRTPLDIGTYIMMHHAKRKPNPDRRQLIGSQPDDAELGSAANYTLISTETLPLYTRVKVSL